MTRTAVVTGAARGIGAATVRALASAGWSVVAVDRADDDPRLPYTLGSARQLQETAASAGDRVTATTADAVSVEAMGHVIADAEERNGGVDAIVAAAGVIAGGVPLWEVPQEQHDAVIETNLGGASTAARVGIPALLRRPVPRSGRFVVVASSAAASRGLPLLASYCAAKAGVVGLVRALGAELRGTGVTANAVSPGCTETEILEESARLYGLGSSEEFASHQPIERLLKPDEVAALIVWLLSPSAGGVLGANLVVDGGLSL